MSFNGFTVEAKMPNGIYYSEADKQRQIDAKTLVSTEPKMANRRNDIKAWASPHEMSEVSEADRDRILDNIHRAFKFQGWVLAVE